MTKIPESCAPVNARQQFEDYVIKTQEGLRQAISKKLNAMLVKVVNYVVGRGHYERREQVPQHLRREGTCSRCGTTRSQRFSRNGYRPRKPLMTPWGEIALDVPRVRCKCGGSVRVDFGGLLRPYQRIADDVDREIQCLGKLGLSLRQMRERLKQLHMGTLALRTLNQRLHQLQNLDPQRADMAVPPILQIDAIWVTL